MELFDLELNINSEIEAKKHNDMVTFNNFKSNKESNLNNGNASEKKSNNSKVTNKVDRSTNTGKVNSERPKQSLLSKLIFKIDKSTQTISNYKHNTKLNTKSNTKCNTKCNTENKESQVNSDDYLKIMEINRNVNLSDERLSDKLLMLKFLLKSALTDKDKSISSNIDYLFSKIDLELESIFFGFNGTKLTFGNIEVDITKKEIIEITKRLLNKNILMKLIIKNKDRISSYLQISPTNVFSCEKQLDLIKDERLVNNLEFMILISYIINRLNFKVGDQVKRILEKPLNKWLRSYLNDLLSNELLHLLKNNSQNNNIIKDSVIESIKNDVIA